MKIARVTAGASRDLLAIFGAADFASSPIDKYFLSIRDSLELKPVKNLA